MRLKVDENLPPEASTLLAEQGHDAEKLTPTSATRFAGDLPPWPG
jgi:hypothetical protein